MKQFTFEGNENTTRGLERKGNEILTCESPRFRGPWIEGASGDGACTVSSLNCSAWPAQQTQAEHRYLPRTISLRYPSPSTGDGEVGSPPQIYLSRVMLFGNGRREFSGTTR
jgi:hypothetical protein